MIIRLTFSSTFNGNITVPSVTYYNTFMYFAGMDPQERLTLIQY